MTEEVCDSSKKPATRFVVRKVLTGQALKSFVANGKLDFSITLDDVIAGGNAHPDVKAAVARNLSTSALDLPLDPGFVVSAGYSLCKGPAGKECSTRVALGSLGSVAAGKLTDVYLASRGQSYMLKAPAPQRAGASGTPQPPSCDGGQVKEVSNVLLGLETPRKVSTCLTSLVAPRNSLDMGYIDTATAPDNQLLSTIMQGRECLVVSDTLVSRPLQGLPVVGTWALAQGLTNASALNKTMDAAPISAATLAAPSGVTGIEVIFLVGTEVRETREGPAYLLEAP